MKIGCIIAPHNREECTIVYRKHAVCLACVHTNPSKVSLSRELTRIESVDAETHTRTCHQIGFRSNALLDVCMEPAHKLSDLK